MGRLDSLFSFTPTVGSAVGSRRAPTLEKRASPIKTQQKWPKKMIATCQLGKVPNSPFCTWIRWSIPKAKRHQIPFSTHYTFSFLLNKAFANGHRPIWHLYQSNNRESIPHPKILGVRSISWPTFTHLTTQSVNICGKDSCKFFVTPSIKVSCINHPLHLGWPCNFLMNRHDTMPVPDLSLEKAWELPSLLFGDPWVTM